MIKKNKLIYIIGAGIIGISFMLIAFFVLLTSGVIDTRPKLVFSSGSVERVYDGTPLTLDSCEMTSGALSDGHSVNVTVSGSRTNAGTSENLFAVKITNASGADVTDAYNIDSRYGELKVIARTLAIKTEGAVKEYDGTPLTHLGHSLTKGSLVPGHSLSVSVTGSRIDAGSSENSFAATVTDSGGADVTHNYSFERATGILEVKKYPISISTPTCIKVYDGAELAKKEWAYASQTEVLDIHQIEVTVNGSQTDAGTSLNSISEVRITENGKNVSHNYEITSLEGELIVTERVLTLRSESDIKVFDFANPTPLKNPNWEIVSITQPVTDHKLEATVSGLQLEPGSSDNYFAEVLIKDGTRDVTFNYFIECQLGVLTVLNADGTRAADSNGSGGSGGGGAVSLDESGEIGLTELSGGDGGDGGEAIAARIYTDNSGRIYLRYMSFGDYTGQAWNKANNASMRLDNIYSLNYLTGLSLKSAGHMSNRASIEVFGSNYLLPQYLDTDTLDYEIQSSDVKHSGATDRVYSAYYYPFNYVQEGLSGVDLKNYAPAEASYFEYVSGVYRMFLSVPSGTKARMEQIIADKGFNKNSPSVIADVADFIMKSAVYNLEYDRDLDKQSDIAVSFFNYGEGVCQHFATAATMLYRALGFPARYTIGYTLNTKKGAWVDVLPANAHAWVEVYVQGIGWVQVEVTGAGAGEDGNWPDGESGNDDGDFEIGEGDLLIKPVDLYLKFKTGAVLNAENRLLGLDSFVLLGYTYKSTVTGRQTAVGIGKSIITSFTLFNPAGEDVTGNFNIILESGKLHIYVLELTLNTQSLTKTYDGEPLKSDAKDCGVSGSLIDGHKISSVTVTGGRISAGISENSFDIRITDSSGKDVTYMYYLSRNFGTLTVETREITVAAGSAEKKFDGTELTCLDFKITEDSLFTLVNGDTVKVELSGSQTDAGKSENIITSITITDKNGNDVTGSYKIILLGGLLNVYR